MPAGFLADGSRQATLKEVVSPKVATVDGAALTEWQRVELTARRIALQRRFKIFALGYGFIGKKQAIEAVKDQTPLGEALIDVEHRAIALLKEEPIRRQQRRRLITRRS